MMKIPKSNAFCLPIFIIMICAITSCSSGGDGNTGTADPTDPASPADPPADGGEEVGEVAPTDCTILQSQVLSPTLQTEVPNGIQADLCDFNVMGWESFLYLVEPVSEGSNERRFEDTEAYPNYLGKEADSCAGQSNSDLLTLFTSATDPSASKEAGTGTEVYSVGPEGSSEGDIVRYNVRFSQNLCGNTASTLPDNLVEIKSAWRVIGSGTNASDYYTIDVTLKSGDQLELGLIGFHLAQTTPLHPEMIWTSWEHVDNAPDCVPSGSSPARPANGWTMMTNSCAACISSDITSPDCTSECKNPEKTSATPININIGRCAENPSSALTCQPPTGAPPDIPAMAEPTNICRVFPEGTQDGDNQSAQNRANIRALNEQIIGEDGYLTNLDPSDPQAVWRNYQMVGGIWFNSDGTPDPTQQRGSIQLANSVMETTFQGSFTPGTGGTMSSSGGFNCFVCHNSSSFPAPQSGFLSHISPYINGPN